MISHHHILRERRINILKKLAGRFLIVTNTDLPESEVVFAYKEQWEIEVEIFKALKPDTSTIHYDLTSSYFEGKEDNDLVLFGYSRDKKRDQMTVPAVLQ